MTDGRRRKDRLALVRFLLANKVLLRILFVGQSCGAFAFRTGYYNIEIKLFHIFFVCYYVLKGRRSGNPAGPETMVNGRLRGTGSSGCSPVRPSGDAARRWQRH